MTLDSALRPKERAMTLFLALLAASLLFVACATEQRPKMAGPKPTAYVVHVQPAHRATQAVGDEVVGTVRARQVAAIAPSVMGTIRALKVTLGSRVKAGQVLAVLSVGEIDAKAAQASAGFAQAGVEMKRAQQLKASQSIPMAEYDAVAARYRVAEAALAEAEAMRAYTMIRAPFAGMITDKRASVGDLAVPGKPLLVLESPGELRLEAAVPEGIMRFLHQGDVMQVRFDALAAPLPARVSELSPSADPASRTVLVKLDLPNLPELRPGMFGRLRVRTGEQTAVLVPSEAIVRRGQLETVFVAEGGRARLRIIRIGRSEQGQTEVLSGLDGNELIVIDQLAQLEDGSPVQVSP